MPSNTCFITITSIVLSTFGMKCNCCCTNPFAVVGSQCLYVDQNERSWSTAQKECKRLGATLATVKNFTAVIDLLTNFWDESGGFWIGGSDRGNEGTWIWHPSGEPILLANPWWAPGEPNNGHGYTSGKEHCLELRKNGFTDIPCTFTNRFICEDARNTKAVTKAVSAAPMIPTTEDVSNTSAIRITNNDTAAVITKEPVACSYCKETYTVKTAFSIMSAILIFVIIGLLAYIYQYCDKKNSLDGDCESLGQPIPRPAWPHPAPKVLPL